MEVLWPGEKIAQALLLGPPDWPPYHPARSLQCLFRGCLRFEKGHRAIITQDSALLCFLSSCTVEYEQLQNSGPYICTV
jgi:hypothetical protein